MLRPVCRNILYCSALGVHCVHFVAIYSCTHGIYISRTVRNLTREMHRRVYLLFLSPKERPCSSYGACLRMMKMVFLKRFKLFNARYALRIRGSFQLLHRFEHFCCPTIVSVLDLFCGRFSSQAHCGWLCYDHLNPFMYCLPFCLY